MKYALGCDTSNEFDDGDCALAVVDMRPELAKLILGRRKAFILLAEKDAKLEEIRFYEEKVRFFSAENLPDDFGDDPVPLTESLMGTEQDVVYQHMVITKECMWWSCCTYEQGITVTTTLVEYEWVEEQIK